MGDRNSARCRAPRALVGSLLSISVVMFLTPALFAQAARAPGLTPEVVDSAGARMFERLIRYHGRIDDPALNAAVSNIVSRLVDVAAHPGLDHLRFAILNDRTINAKALPGGHLVINIGLIEWQKKIATSRDDTWTDYLAAVVGHELAHITLGHTTDFTQLLADKPGDGFDPEELWRTKQSREAELEADAIGALYLLRAGWEIQTTMDFFRLLDQLERDGGSYYDIGAATYIRTHPRASEREAELEAFRAELKRDQVRFDDALTLIRNNVEVERAVGLLDTVIGHFPRLLPALHARATAWHVLYLSSMPVERQFVRGSLPVYEIYFLPEMRFAPEIQDQDTLGVVEYAQDPLGVVEYAQAARADYQAVLAYEALPYAESNLGTLEALFDNHQTAYELARHAAMLEPENPFVLNNLGVVLYMRGDDVEAYRTFKRVYDLTDSDPVLFNLGRLALEMGLPEGKSLLTEYLSRDSQSGWARIAESLLDVE